MDKAFELAEALGKESIMDITFTGKHRVLYKGYSFYWFKSSKRYRCWKQDPKTTSKTSGYNEKVDDFKTIKEILKFLKIERAKELFSFKKADEFIRKIKKKVLSFKLT